MKDLNITIVNYKAKDEIEKCLQSFFASHKNSNLNFIVHVVDNSDNADGIGHDLAEKFSQVVYINSQGNIGFGKAQNLGLNKEKAKFYAIINPDIEFVEENSFDKIIAFFEENKKIGLVGPKLLNLDDSLQHSCYRFPGVFDQFYRRLGWREGRVKNYLMHDFSHQENREVDWIMGAFMVAKHEMVEQIGFFDDRFFMYFEDCDWCRRAWQNNWQVHYLADVTARHTHKRESTFNIKLAKIHLESWMKYFYKYAKN